MNPRERILAAMNHEIPDRTPTTGWFHQTVQEMLKEHYHTDRWQDVLQELGIDADAARAMVAEAVRDQRSS